MRHWMRDQPSVLLSSTVVRKRRDILHRREDAFIERRIVANNKLAEMTIKRSLRLHYGPQGWVTQKEGQLILRKLEELTLSNRAQGCRTTQALPAGVALIHGHRVR